MHIVWWILTGIFAISAFVGLVRFINHQLYKRSSSAITLVVSLIGVFSFFSLATHPQGLSQADQQKTLTSFINQIDKNQQPELDAEKAVQDSLSQFNGSDTSSLKKVAIQLKNESAVAEDKVPSVPSGFPGDVDTLLSEVNSDFTLAFHDEYNGADSLSKYLDSQNPNDLQSYKDKTASAKNYISQANINLDLAKQKVGLK